MATFVYDGDGKRVKATAGGVTTAYVGDYFEWSGSTSTMVKYYYAGTVRVAMQVGSNNPKWLLSDHLGSQSIVASDDGLTEEGELRYKAWGETRYTYGTTPTERQYTGQLTLACTSSTPAGTTAPRDAGCISLLLTLSRILNRIISTPPKH